MVGLDENIKEMVENKVIAFKEDLLSMLTGSRGLSNDSRAVNSMKVVVNESDKYVALEAIDYIYYVIHGRGPGKFPPPNEKGEWPLPYPAAKKIAEEGNLQKYKPFADEFNKMYDQLIKEVDQESKEIAKGHITSVLSFKNKQIWKKQ